MAVDYDPALIGKVFEVTDPVNVSAEDIGKFCTAISETNPLYTDEAAAKKGAYGGIVAGKDVEFRAPIRPGDKITLSSHVKEIYEKTGRSGSMVFVVVRSTVQNQNGEVVAHIDHRFMNRP